jgi:hypothetical protein
VDYARRFRSEKRGGGKVCATLFDADNAVWQLDERLLAVDGALHNRNTGSARRQSDRVAILRGLDGNRSRGGAGNLGYYIETRLGFRPKLAGSSARMTGQSKFQPSSDETKTLDLDLTPVPYYGRIGIGKSVFQLRC